MVLAIVGDITQKEAAAAERAFEAGRAARPPPGAVPFPEPTRRVVIVDKPDAVQTETSGSWRFRESIRTT